MYGTRLYHLDASYTEVETDNPDEWAEQIAACVGMVLSGAARNFAVKGRPLRPFAFAGQYTWAGSDDYTLKGVPLAALWAKAAKEKGAANV